MFLPMRSIVLAQALLLLSNISVANTNPDAPWFYHSLDDGLEQAGWIHDVSKTKSAAVLVYYSRETRKWFLLYSYISKERMVHLEEVIVKKENRKPPVSVSLDIGSCKGGSCIKNDKTKVGWRDPGR